LAQTRRVNLLRPLSDIIHVEIDNPEEISSGGIVIPVVAQEQADKGTVIAAGPGKMWETGLIKPMEVKVGDKILFTKYAKLEFKFEGKTLYTMHEADIIGIIE
jgi:chaperonin GroES